MATLSKEQLTSKIRDFTSQRGSCLFAGAGVAKRAGLVSWQEYLEHLCSTAGRYDKDLEMLMRKRLKANAYVEAAALYKTAIEIPVGIKYTELASPFTKLDGYYPNKLHALMTLPFTAVVTTNYDRSLHDAYWYLFTKQKESGLSLKAPKYVEFGDLSMRQAIFWTDFYIARIHGRAEIPETIVLDREDYLRTENDPYYQDFLLHILKNYHCLFLGYSFVDPAINRILDLMHAAMPLTGLSLHLAILASDCDEKLRYELAKYNIETIEYDPADNHETLWESIKDAQHEIRTLPRKAPDKVEPMKGLGRFLATCYSRLKLGSKAEPLRDIVVQGIIIQTIIEAGPDGIKRKALIEALKRYISLTDKQLEDLINRTADRLLSKKICTQEEGVLKCKESGDGSFDKALSTLVDGVANRLKVREGIEADYELRSSIVTILNELLLIRGWDLGAHFAGGHPSSSFEAWPQVQDLIEKLTKTASSHKSKALANTIFDLFRHPEDQEAELLADVGRIAFAVELILNNARSTLQLFFIPEIIYLDANVLMPAIVEGHPYSPVYADAISRMNEAGNTVGVTISVSTGRDFLNEIINHRNLAIQEVQEQRLEDVDRLRHQMLIYGAGSTNVFIGAYASFVGREGQAIPFGEFLRKVAPYSSESALEEYLNKQGIQTTTFSFSSAEEKVLYGEIKGALHHSYEELEEFGELPRNYQKKPKVLIDHEAAQLTRLVLDTKSRRKPLFVTADKRLMGLCRGEVLGNCANAIISHLAFIQLVDLILGMDTDRRSLTRLFWTVELTDEETIIRNYLIDIALHHYDDAQAMAMWDVVDRISEEAAQAAKKEGIVFLPGREENKARTANFLDRFEQEFFKKMAEAIRKREMGSPK
jgi:hypothetical protein